MATILVATSLPAQQGQLPAGYPPGLYDESKVPQYTLPDPLVMLNGEKVRDVRTWRGKRRPEILKLFETQVYGRTLIGKPKEMSWRVTSEDQHAMHDSAVTKIVRILFLGREDGPKMDLSITLPSRSPAPVPVFLVPGWMSDLPAVVQRGYGVANFSPWSVEPDNKDSAYAHGIRRYFAAEGQVEPKPDEWGTIGAWAWAASRAMDYLMADPDIDPHKICIMGLSRFGKTAMWAGAQDERFAAVFSCESGTGGATIVRRGFGETVRAINGQFPHWFDGNFKTYNDRVQDLPVDWHMLVALMAPRPVYIATAERDYWGDPYGAFLAAKSAEPVFELFGKRGLGLDTMPPVETPAGITIGYHMRKGGHGLNSYDWACFLDFADRQLGIGKRRE
ncbi:acetylxylan esterase [bacterium]|nr:MAG: acetylxylan esterase [bacterium]